MTEKTSTNLTIDKDSKNLTPAGMDPLIFISPK